MSTTWRCSHRRKGDLCYASVNQRGDVFTPGQAHHNHPPDPLMMKRVILKRDVSKNKQRDRIKCYRQNIQQSEREI